MIDSLSERMPDEMAKMTPAPQGLRRRQIDQFLLGFRFDLSLRGDQCLEVLEECLARDWILELADELLELLQLDGAGLRPGGRFRLLRHRRGHRNDEGGEPQKEQAAAKKAMEYLHDQAEWFILVGRLTLRGRRRTHR